MSSILTNHSAMTALSTLRNINSDLSDTQSRISTGLSIASGKDNAAYFSISKTMSGDSGMYKAIDENLTLQQNAVSTARLGAETMVDLAQEFSERVAFAQGGTAEVRADVQAELDELAARMSTTIAQATFNGTDYVNANSSVTVVTGISRSSSGSISTTTMSFLQQDLGTIQATLAAIDLTTATSAGSQAAALQSAEAQLAAAVSAATSLGIAEKSIETQKEFLGELTDRLDSGIGSMIDANMEEEAARLQALQVQQQLATQSLSIANSAPQNILSLFR
ncbi:flagellin N-terminal helical domain-containing protein [Pseudooceanicola nitratireducens]|uniref:Flagellin n=1 Tax=Pseudooceanicola nitratireducens TaxID=517719 RepID=A0A1I1PXM1_9RHOB|nr:flagellin [Pseudooceanicola nitratireducens]MEC7793523.1 flagellin [Pseudomonadota bacterium]MBY6159044.1 flagellar protein [Pseudooceanicola nitratireducens]MBY6167451.1 flagellar protein [Pseudooceanicola nitratireducens]SEJ70508.1 flagellin [Pseudooceanicola nitratireducens]SFD14671.1 flagellin [Pseudooceanicola nitratireducens]